MAHLYIGEYSDIGSTGRGSVPIPQEPVNAEQSVEIGVTSKASDTLSAATTLVRLVSDVDCAIAIGADPDATNSVRSLAAGSETILTVAAGSKLKIAVVAKGSGSMSDSLGAFLNVVANPTEAKKTLDALNAQSAVIDASSQTLRVATDAHRKAKADADAAALKADAAKAENEKTLVAVAAATANANADAAARLVSRAADKAADVAREARLKEREDAAAAAALAAQVRSNDLDAHDSSLAKRESDLADKAKALAAAQADHEARVSRLRELTR